MIIGFSGRAGAGKDTAGKVLTDLGWVKISFAEPLKRMLCELFGWQMEQWEDLEWKETPNALAHGETPRRLAQTLGTDWGRNLIHENLWISIAIARAKYLESKGTNVVFTDLRFPNEVEAVIAAGGYAINIKRLGALRTDSVHESEQDLSELAATNISAEDGDVEGLRQAVLAAVQFLPVLTFGAHQS